LHRELRDLADRQGRPAPAEQRFPGDRILPNPGARSRVFAADVAARLEGPVLRHSQRRRLLKAAQQAGIGRFEANLIIAAVQHERRGSAAQSPCSRSARGRDPRDGLAAIVCAALVIALQGIIVWGAWRVWWA
jgi:hypothetical protein